jgi:hypothetical protein
MITEISSFIFVDSPELAAGGIFACRDRDQNASFPDGHYDRVIGFHLSND